MTSPVAVVELLDLFYNIWEVRSRSARDLSGRSIWKTGLTYVLIFEM